MATSDESKDGVPNWDALWAEYQERVAAQKEYHDTGIDIYPSPGFVLKTRLLDHNKSSTAVPSDRDAAEAHRAASLLFIIGAKVFVNFCHDPLIAPPSGEGTAEIKLRIPLSCGAPRHDVDKKGETCIVFDVVFNPGTIADCKDAQFKREVCTYALSSLQNKHSIKLSTGWKYLEDRKYVGQGRPAPQRIRRPQPKKEPLISEIVDEDEPKAAKSSKGTSKKVPSSTSAPTSSSASPAVSTAEADVPRRRTAISSSTDIEPVYELFCTNADGKRIALAEFERLSTSTSAALPASFIIDIELPGINRMNELDVQISTIDLVLSTIVSDNSGTPPYKLQVLFPFVIADDRAEAKFSKKNATLTLSLPVTSIRTASSSTTSISNDTTTAPTSTTSASAGERDWKSELGLCNPLIFAFVQ